YATEPQAISQAECNDGAREVKFHLNLQLQEAGRETQASSHGWAALFLCDHLVFPGAAPEAAALQRLMHRYDAVFVEEGCAAKFRSAQFIKLLGIAKHYKPA